MLQRLRRRRSFWAAVAAGIFAVPALFGGVAAAPSDSTEPLPPPERDLEGILPPDPATAETAVALAQADSVADLVPAAYRDLVIATATRHRVDPRLIAAIVTVETGWDSTAVGSKGELGLMQILPSTGAFLARQAGLAQYNLADPATNLDLGARYIFSLLEQYGTTERALAAYNGGPSAVKGWKTNRYAQKVLKHLNKPDRPRTPTTTYGHLLAS